MPDYSVAMAGKQNHDKIRRRLRELADDRELNLSELSQQLGYNRGYLENFIRKQSPRLLSLEDRMKLVELTPLSAGELEVDIHIPDSSQRKVVRPNDTGLGSVAGGLAGGDYQTLTEKVFVIGSVQAGAWMEATQLPETEWTEMLLPTDKRFPGTVRYGLLNRGSSMNKVCRDGGVWVFVRFADLTGVGPSPGQYVIVERERKDGLVEATAKRFELGPGGKPLLCPESDDPSFQPIEMAGGADIKEIRIIGRVVDIINRV